MNDKLKQIINEIKKVIIGQDEVIKLFLTTILANGHAILEGVPGLAKTLLINTIAKATNLSFNRIQFTPDMVPSDITGTEIIDFIRNENNIPIKEFRFIPGPIFSEIILADEINRTPPKTQSALLQAMQEKKVTILGKTYNLPNPFFVFATQNPIEYEGTYPLPEAQLDRFLFNIKINYPSKTEEKLILESNQNSIENVNPVISKSEILSLINEAEKIPVSDSIKDYILDIAINTRPESTKFDFIKKYVQWGVGPRASQMILKAAKSYSFLNNKLFVDKDDVDYILLPCLRHRIILNYNAISENIKTDDIIIYLKNNLTN